MRVAVVVADNKPEALAASERVLALVAHRGWEAVTVLARQADPPSISDCHLVVVLGGDGTFLAAARLAIGSEAPLLGVDLGRLGFLSEVDLSELPEALARFESGDYKVESRAMLHILARRGEHILGEATALNDAAISKGAFARLVELEAHLDGAYLSSYHADGLVVATPTGSTAYALSAGGPVLAPNLDVMVLTPVCPHTLGARPFVVGTASVLRLVVRGPVGEDLVLAADGQPLPPLRAGDEVVLRLSPHRTRMVRLGGAGFFERLRTKLHWGTSRGPA